ncbi:MAG: hypothetical protein IPJ77_23535 [Planctomycetes bacterium]|nr:hypothetical protein [Planctomycetota bacterium]
MTHAIDSHLHDWIIHAYEYWGDKAVLVLHARSSDASSARLADVVFEGVDGHHFEHVLDGNIVFDLREIDPEPFVASWSDLFARSLSYGFPCPRYSGSDVTTLPAYIRSRGLHCYALSTSYGMYGFVIANSCRIVDRGTRSDPATDSIAD